MWKLRFLLALSLVLPASGSMPSGCGTRSQPHIAAVLNDPRPNIFDQALSQPLINFLNAFNHWRKAIVYADLKQIWNRFCMPWGWRGEFVTAGLRVRMVGYAPHEAVVTHLAMAEDNQPLNERRGKVINAGDVQALIRTTHNRAEAVEILAHSLAWKVTRHTLTQYLIRNQLTAPWQRPRWKIAPEEAARVIQRAQSRNEAAAAISTTLGRKISAAALRVYMHRHGLLGPWQDSRRSADPSPESVQQLIRGTHSRAEALERLHKELGWVRSLRTLDTYIKRHALTAPWQLAVSWHIDHARLQELVQRAPSLTEAVRLVREQLDRPLTPSALSQYIHRHGLVVPWTRRRRGSISFETTLCIAAAGVVATVAWIVMTAVSNRIATPSVFRELGPCAIAASA